MPRSSVAIGVGALLLAVGAAGALLLVGSRPTPSPSGETAARAEAVSPDEPEAPPLPPVPAPPSPETRERSTSIPDFASRQTASVRGRIVMRGTGAPVGSATVSLRTGKNAVDYPETTAALGGEEGIDRLWKTGEFDARLAAIGGWKHAFKTESAPDGSFAIAAPPDVPRFQFRVVADFALYRDKEAWFTLDSPSVRDGVTLELDSAGRVEGTVADREGKPAGGARVALVREPFDPRDRIDPVVADADGRFAFRAIPPGRFAAGALAEGTGPQVRPGVDVRPGETTRLDFSLPTECFLAGRVVDETGAGVAGARLNAFSEENRAPNALAFVGYGNARSAADGSFRMGSLRAGPHRLAVRREGMLAPEPTTVDVPETGEVADLRLVLSKGHAVAGRILDAGRHPIAGASVRASPDFSSSKAKTRAGSFGHQSARTAEDGSFRLAGLSEGPLVLEAQAEGRGSAELREVEADSEGVEIVLLGPTGVAGVVLEADTGKPVPKFTVGGQRVTRRMGEFAMSSEGLPEKAFQSVDGSFEHLDLKPGSLDLTFDAEGFVPEVVQKVEVKSGEVRRDLDVRLRRGAAIRGRVVARDTGEPVAEATVDRVEEGKRPFGPILHRLRRGDAKSDSDGAFEIRSLEPGSVQLRVSHEAFAVTISDPVEAKGGETVEGIVIPLFRGGALDGYAIGEGGAPLAGGKIQTRPMGDFRERWSQSKESPIDEAGYFKLEGLSPGWYRVEARPPWPGRGEDAFGTLEGKTLRALAEVEEGRTIRVEFPALPKGRCTVRGRVLRGDAGVEGAQVSVTPSVRAAGALSDPYGDRMNARTKADGSFAIEHVPAGSATLHVQAPSSREPGESSGSSQRSIEVPDGPELVLDVTLSGGAIAGRVVRASDRKPLSGVSVGIFPADLPPGRANPKGHGWAHTDEEGRYRVIELEPGTYVVRAGGGVGIPASGEEGAFAGETRDGVEVREGDEVALDFALSAGGTAVVTVLDPGGRPVKGAFVGLIASGRASGVRKFLGGSQGTTDGEGVARVDGLSPGLYYATVYWAQFAGAESEEAAVRAGSETSFRVELREGTRVRARVQDKNDAPVELLPLFVDSRGRERIAAPSGMRGSPRPGEEGMGIAVLLPGEYTVRIGGGGWMEQTTTIRVGTDSPQDFVLRVEREEGPK
ncbi:MAG TPA: carboxypeptidase regulatory-like domain-containing protein [Planctomycetota bacterium]|jgi:protocatechuate 3,4-dioxygenase beta subunit|nr:carboxypeptidase regulatory-like domain-containing protein [Planctomycetota bacterium]